MAVSKGLLAGLAVVIIVVAGIAILSLRDIFGNTTADLQLAMSGQNCAITTHVNDKDVAVKKNKKITWRVRNDCTSDQFVSVGNLRTTPNDPGNVANCKVGIAETTWPFKPQDQAHRSVYVPAGKSDNIVLKEAKNETGAEQIYYFDICVGAQKKDPRLVVDPY